jgi:hypothetical protein
MDACYFKIGYSAKLNLKKKKPPILDITISFKNREADEESLVKFEAFCKQVYLSIMYIVNT